MHVPSREVACPLFGLNGNFLSFHFFSGSRLSRVTDSLEDASSVLISRLLHPLSVMFCMGLLHVSKFFTAVIFHEVSHVMLDIFVF